MMSVMTHGVSVLTFSGFLSRLQKKFNLSKSLQNEDMDDLLKLLLCIIMYWRGI